MAEGKPRQGPIREKPQLIADELRALIVAGDLSEGESLGHEPDLIERFGVSRPSLREALRILEAEGLISVVRGASGGVVVHEPNERMTARTAALVLQARNVSLADVHQARSLLEPAAAATIARSGRRRSAGNQLALLIDEQERHLEDPDGFGAANAAFHERLVTLAGNQTLTIVAEMLNEIVSRAVTAVSQAGPNGQSSRTRRRGISSQRRLVELIAAGDGAAAEEHWRAHMAVVGQVLLGQQATTVVDLLDHY
ncbi:MAG: FadR/GntR family transcriptional regulator [Acidimicrobiales bacterium]|jgi:DNA-binding FadR family transcriptional regulator